MGDVRDFRNFMGAVIDKRAFTKIGEYLDDATQERERRRRRRREGRARAISSSRRSIETRRSRTTGCCARRSSARWSRRTSTTTRSGSETLRDRRPDVAVRAHRRRVRARPRGGARGDRSRCATRPETSTSTTSRRARWSVSSRSAARAASGTNDKAGSKLNLVRWVSPRTIKETFSPPTDYTLSVHGGGIAAGWSLVARAGRWSRARDAHRGIPSGYPSATSASGQRPAAVLTRA